jgi:hypothetical protein
MRQVAAIAGMERFIFPIFERMHTNPLSRSNLTARTRRHGTYYTNRHAFC